MATGTNKIFLSNATILNTHQAFLRFLCILLTTTVWIIKILSFLEYFMDRMAEFMSEDGKLATDGIPSEKIPIDMNLTTVNRSYFSRRLRRKIRERNLRRETRPQRPRTARTIRVTRVGLEPSAIARGVLRRIFRTSLISSSEMAEDDWELG